MRRAYLLAFSNDLGTTESVKACLETMPEVLTWRYDMTNAFYIISECSADLLCGSFKSRIKSNGRFIISEIGANKQGWLTEGSWHLINNKFPMPEKQ